MDADISLSEATPNNFRAFFVEHGSVRLIAFNGRKAEQLFGRFVAPLGIADEVPRVVLPSTSPAYASLSFSGKVAAWRNALVSQ